MQGFQGFEVLLFSGLGVQGFRGFGFGVQVLLFLVRSPFSAS